ncbi:MAG: hypothetical protein MZV65_39835 [Chromatiales bacterium]|nr:hypothetical protein [Chromatiales bacterium]
MRPLLKSPGVEWLGSVAHEQVPAVLASLDVLVVPSIWIENCAVRHQGGVRRRSCRSSPRILAAWPNSCEDGRNGLLFTAGDPADLRRVIARLLDEPGLLAKLREGLPRVKTIDEDAAWTQALYEEVVRERTRAPRHGSGTGPVDCGGRPELQHAGRHAARGRARCGPPGGRSIRSSSWTTVPATPASEPLSPCEETRSATSAAPATSGSPPGATSGSGRRWTRARTWCSS